MSYGHHYGGMGPQYVPLYEPVDPTQSPGASGIWVVGGLV